MHIRSSESSSGQHSTQREVSAVSKEKQQLIAEVDEKKRRMLREVEVCIAANTIVLNQYIRVCGVNSIYCSSRLLN